MTVWLQEALPFSLPSMDSSLFAFPFSKLILKEINPEYSLGGLMMKLKLQYFGHLMWKADIRKDPDGGKDWRQKEQRTTEDEMVGWHHWLNGHESEEALGVGDEQESLACYNPWGWKESDTSEQLNWTEPGVYSVL